MKLRILTGVLLLAGLMIVAIGCGPGTGTANTSGHKSNKDGTNEVPPIQAKP